MPEHAGDTQAMLKTVLMECTCTRSRAGFTGLADNNVRKASRYFLLTLQDAGAPGINSAEQGNA